MIDRRTLFTVLCLSFAVPTLGQDTSTLSSIDDPGNPEDLSLLSGSESDDLAGAAAGGGGADTKDLPGPTTDNKQPAGAPSGVKTIYSKNQCTFDISDAHGATYHYDVSPLSRPNGEGKDDYLKEIQVGPNIQFIYRMNICANTQNICQDEPSPATESLKIPAGETCRILGRLVDESDPIAANHGQYSLVPSLNTDTSKNPSQQDLIITYNNGDLCDPAKQTMRSVSIHLVCDNSLAPSASVFKDVKKEATCNTEYIFHSKYACPTSASKGPKTFLMLGIIGFVLYFGIGALILRFHYKEEGVENLIIHKSFWEDVPSLAKEGCSYSMDTVKSFKENGMGSFGGVGGAAFGSGGGSGSGSGSNDVSSPSAYGSGSSAPAEDYA